MASELSTPAPTSVDALDVLDMLIEATALQANKAAIAAAPHFDEMGAGAGVGIRLKAFEDARQAIRDARLRHLEGKG
jgi:hypothetical protein